MAWCSRLSQWELHPQSRRLGGSWGGSPCTGMPSASGAFDWARHTGSFPIWGFSSSADPLLRKGDGTLLQPRGSILRVAGSVHISFSQTISWANLLLFSYDPAPSVLNHCQELEISPWRWLRMIALLPKTVCYWSTQPTSQGGGEMVL